MFYVFFLTPHGWATLKPLVAGRAGMGRTTECVPGRRYDIELGGFVVAMGQGPLKKYDCRIPFGKRLHNCGTSPFFIGKSTINGHFQYLF